MIRKKCQCMRFKQAEVSLLVAMVSRSNCRLEQHVSMWVCACLGIKKKIEETFNGSWEINSDPLNQFEGSPPEVVKCRIVTEHPFLSGL